MTGIEMLREWANELREAAWAYHDGEIGYVPIDVEACQRKNAARLDAIADQIEREIDEAVADEVADTLSAYDMNTNARWHSAVEEGEESDCKAEFELISRYWLPRLRFEGGEIVKIGDEFVSDYGKQGVVEGFFVQSDGVFGLVPKNSADRIMYLSGKRVKRPEPPKVLDADGVEIKVGDEVWFSGSGCGPCKVSSVLENEMVTVESEHVSFTDLGFEFTHKRPEPPDSWERVEADVNKGSACRYFGVPDSEEECGKCTAQWDEGDMSCAESMARDVLRRCKKLAGVE